MYETSQVYGVRQRRDGGNGELQPSLLPGCPTVIPPTLLVVVLHPDPPIQLFIVSPPFLMQPQIL